MSADDSVLPPGPAAPRLSRRKQLLFYLVLGLLLLVFAEAALQVFYRASVGRWLWQWWAVPIYETDPVRLYRLKSHLDFTHRTREYTARYLTDARGLRIGEGEPSLPAPKSNGVFRVLALGPSFAFGWGVNNEECYMRQIADGLRVPGRRIELVNLGTPSQPVSYQLKWLRETGHGDQPDLIVQTVFGSPGALECDDQLPPVRPKVRDGYLQLQPVTWWKKLRLWSASLFYGWHLYQGVMDARAGAAGDGREFYRKEESVSDAECLRRYRSYLEFVRAAVTNRHQVVFLHVPQAHVVRPADHRRAKDPVDPFDARRHAARITSLLRSNGIHFLNPTEALVEKDRSARMYYLYDIHFTPAGNNAVSEYVLPRLQSIVAPENRAR